MWTCLTWCSFSCLRYFASVQRWFWVFFRILCFNLSQRWFFIRWNITHWTFALMITWMLVNALIYLKFLLYFFLRLIILNLFYILIVIFLFWVFSFIKHFWRTRPNLIWEEGISFCILLGFLIFNIKIKMFIFILKCGFYFIKAIVFIELLR